MFRKAEKWKEVKNAPLPRGGVAFAESYYEISSWGRIRRLYSSSSWPKGFTVSPTITRERWYYRLHVPGGKKKIQWPCAELARMFWGLEIGPIKPWVARVRKLNEADNEALRAQARETRAVRRRQSALRRGEMRKVHKPKEVPSFWNEIKPLVRGVTCWSPEFDPMSRGFGWIMDGTGGTNGN